MCSTCVLEINGRGTSHDIETKSPQALVGVPFQVALAVVKRDQTLAEQSSGDQLQAS